MYVCGRVGGRGGCKCAPRRCARTLAARQRLAVLIARPASRAPRVRLSIRARSAAGVSWTSRTTGAPWAGRFGHTSVIDAAGAIYVLGGYRFTTRSTYYRDVWVSTDGGVRARTRAGGGGGVGGYKVGTLGGTRGT